MNPKTLYFVAGEASGDAHGAALMRALHEAQPDLRFRGRGGPRMNTIAGAELIDWIDEAGVVGLWEVIKHYRYFRRSFAPLLEKLPPQTRAVILIDYPGFNLRLARALKRRSPGAKNYLLHQPAGLGLEQRPNPAMARSLDLMLCIFPFEADLQTDRDCALSLSVIR